MARPVDSSTATQVDPARRAHAVAQVPFDYPGRAHLGALLLMALSMLGFGAAQLEEMTLMQAGVAIPSLLLANAVEWWLHQSLLHEPGRLRMLYQRHTLTHHVVFFHQDMAMRHVREIKLVLFPLWALPLMALLVSPLALLAGGLAGSNAGWVFMLSAVAYYLAYELLHLSYHLPYSHPVTRWGGLARLGEHHRRHHNPARMRQGNFNVTVPLWDTVMGTRLEDEG